MESYMIPLLFLAVVIAIFATGLAYWFSSAEEPRSVHRRATLAGGIAAGLVFLVPITVVVIEAYIIEVLIVTPVLLVMAAFFAAVIGFPVAYHVARFVDARRAGSNL